MSKRPQFWAVQGRKDEALKSLERAFQRGMAAEQRQHRLRDIADEPAFRSLHGDPRFKQLRARLAAHYARERDESSASYATVRRSEAGLTSTPT